jgi:hypothetical protein
LAREGLRRGREGPVRGVTHGTHILRDGNKAVAGPIRARQPGGRGHISGNWRKSLGAMGMRRACG